MAEFSGGRRCMICGAAISDDNPDGIGYTCREVWQEAEKDAIYHFVGLELWQRKVDFWLPMFILAFRNTKFRSQFKKEFFASCFTRYSEAGHFSSKQLNIIKEWLIGPFGKFVGAEADVILEDERNIYREIRQAFRDSRTPEQTEYMVNCAKKHYGESKKEA
jgi:hypothetical protein